MRSFILVLLVARCTFGGDNDWSAYGRDAGGTRYSPLKQITRDNVSQLKVAWTYHTGALQPETERNEKAAFEATPILIDGTLYLTHAIQRRDRARSRDRRREVEVRSEGRPLARLFRSHFARCGGLDRREGGQRMRRADCASSKEPSTRGSSRSTARPASPARISARTARWNSGTAWCTGRSFAATTR